MKVVLKTASILPIGLWQTRQGMTRFRIISLSNPETLRRIMRWIEQNPKIRCQVFRNMAQNAKLQREILAIIAKHPGVQRKIIAELTNFPQLRRAFLKIADQL
ncbi:MAG: hypothetical protein DMG68_08890 [Acidobacteria bacterium]|nr:MAG: hypothetical protein DMG68_08890 [Acidobacteriota bacterium]